MYMQDSVSMYGARSHGEIASHQIQPYENFFFGCLQKI